MPSFEKEKEGEVGKKTRCHAYLRQITFRRDCIYMEVESKLISSKLFAHVPFGKSFHNSSLKTTVIVLIPFFCFGPLKSFWQIEI